MNLLRKRAIIIVPTALLLFLVAGIAQAERPTRRGKAKPIQHEQSVIVDGPKVAIPALVIPAGPHWLHTQLGTSHVPIHLPADFFFPGSDAIDQDVYLEGTPIGSKPKRADSFRWRFARLVAAAEVEQEVERTVLYDTVMEQLEGAELPEIGSQVTVPLELVEVQMTSDSPIVVTGSETRLYNLTVELTHDDPTGRRPSQTGYMTFTRDDISTGHFVSEFYAFVRLTFAPIEGGESVVFDYDKRGSAFNGAETPFFIPDLYPAQRQYWLDVAEQFGLGKELVLPYAPIEENECHCPQCAVGGAPASHCTCP